MRWSESKSSSDESSAADARFVISASRCVRRLPRIRMQSSALCWFILDAILDILHFFRYIYIFQRPFSIYPISWWIVCIFTVPFLYQGRFNGSIPIWTTVPLWFPSAAYFNFYHKAANAAGNGVGTVIHIGAINPDWIQERYSTNSNNLPGYSNIA